MLKAAAHETIPTGYKEFHFRDLAKELGNEATVETPLDQKRAAEPHPLGEDINQEKLNQESEQLIMESLSKKHILDKETKHLLGKVWIPLIVFLPPHKAG